MHTFHAPPILLKFPKKVCFTVAIKLLSVSQILCITSVSRKNKVKSDFIKAVHLKDGTEVQR